MYTYTCTCISTCTCICICERCFAYTLVPCSPSLAGPAVATAPAEKAFSRSLTALGPPRPAHKKPSARRRVGLLLSCAFLFCFCFLALLPPLGWFVASVVACAARGSLPPLRGVGGVVFAWVSGLGSILSSACPSPLRKPTLVAERGSPPHPLCYRHGCRRAAIGRGRCYPSVLPSCRYSCCCCSRRGFRLR